jgi:PKD repeat protein
VESLSENKIIMRKIFYLLIAVLVVSAISCSDDDFPVPPASTVPAFSVSIDNNEFAPATVTFTNQSIIPERAGAVTYYWNFGDGTSSNQPSPTHLYEEPGAYPVNLVIVTQGSLEIIELTKNIVIKDPNASGTPLYFTDGASIFSGLINSQAPIVTPLGIDGLGDVYGMTIDTVNSKLYIADYDAGKIYRSDLDGSNFEEFRSGIGEPDALVIDYDENQLYWDTSNGIRRGDLDDTNLNQFEDFVTGQSNDPEGIAIDPVTRKLFWNNYDGGVWVKNLDGTGQNEIIPGGQGGGSVIIVGNKIYFDEYIASGDIHLKAANFDGSNISTVATGISRVVYGIAYEPEENKIYWVDRNKGTIMRANLDGTSPEPWYVDTNIGPRGIAIGKKM